ncbi:MAG: hypothetical protein J5588_03315, partial [Bacteroidales bacterium]|nr:hypothetical protein [Bacteroidales bacterium]
MKKFVCSLLLVLSALFSMAQNYTSNGGTLEFKSGGTGNFPLIGCIGDDFSITIVDSESLIASVTPDDPSNPTLTYANGKLFGSLVGTAYGTQYQYTVKDGDGEETGKFILFVMETPSDQTISTEATSFTIGKNYMFQVSEAMQTYEWSVTTSQTDGYQFMNQSEASCSLWFLKQGTYILNYNGSSAGGCASPTATYTINVTGSQTITYTASDETLCKDLYAIYQISASESITTTLELQINGQSFSPVGTLNGNDMYCQFDLSGFSSTAGTYTASLVDVLDGKKEVASAQLTFLAAPTVPEISTTAQSFETGENYYSFTATTTTENCSYSWGTEQVPDGVEDIYINNSIGQNTIVFFPVSGTYKLICMVVNSDGCRNIGHYTAEVTEGTPIVFETVPDVTICTDNLEYYTLIATTALSDYSSFKITDIATNVSSGSTVSGYEVTFPILFVWEAGAHQTKITDRAGNVLGTPTFTVVNAPETPTITSTHTTFLAGEQYVFMASSNTSGVTYKWTLAGDGASIVGDNNMESVTVAFNSTLDQGTFQLICEVSNNGCTVVGSKNIEVSSGATQQDITYNAPNATLCRGDNMAYTIMASESIPSTTTLKMTVGLESFTGYSKGDSYVFDLSGMTPTSGTFNAEIVDITNGTTIATPTITVNASPYVVISSTEQSFSTGTIYEFTATSDASNGTYMWSMGTYPDGGTYEFVNGYSSQSTTIKFNTAGQYELWCAVTDANGCSSNNFTYVTVEEGSSTPVTVTNGGSVTFVPGSSATLVGCVGEYPYVSFEGENLNLAQPQSGSGSGQANFSEGSYNSFTFEFVSAGTYYFNIYPVGQENDIMVLNLQINEKPDVPTITSSDDTFLAGQTYTFTANTSSQDVTYEWTLSGLPYDGASIDGSNTEKTVSVVFNSALQPGQGTFTLYCEVISNGCSAIGQKNIEMSSGTTQQDITYTAQPQTFCYKNDGQYEYVVKASQAVEEDDYIMVLLSYSSYYGSYHSDATDGDEIYFRLNNLPAAEYEVMIYSSDSLNLLVESATMTVGAPIRPTISWEDGEFYVGETVSFYNENYDETLTYTWSVDNADHTFVGATDGEGVSITFLNTGDFVVKCEATENGCTSSDTYSLEVVNAVCSIDGTKYSTLTEALNAVQSGDVILVLDDISEADSVITLNSSFTLNTNGHTINFGAIQGMASRTITGGGILNTALENSNTNGSDVLTIDGATLNLNGVQWMAKGMITLTNNASVTLTDGIFLGGGDDDGFNLSIDNTSSFNVNGKSIWGYNYERIASQMSPYLPSGYTVTGTSDGLEFSPDANVTLSVQSAEPITYTAEAVTTCFNEWDEGEFVVTASDVVEGSYVMTFGEYELTTQRTDGDQIYFELKNIPAGTYNVTVWNSDKSKQLCTSTLTILDSSLEVEGPEEGVTNEPLTFTVTNPVSGVTYNWVVEMYGGDSNSPADPSSYTADSFEGTTFTVTFLEADEYYRITCNSSCGYGTEMALDISEAPNYVKVIELPKSSYGENLWQINSSGATTLVQDAVTAAEVDDYTPQIGDVFSYTLKGVASFTGTVGFYLVDVSSAACYWAPFTDSTASYHENNQFQVTKGESFEISGELEITNLSWDNWRACGAVTLTNPSLDIEAHSADGLLEDEVVTLSLTEYSLTFTEAEIERTYHIYGKAIACNGETTTVQIAAPQGFANPSDIKITGQMGTITPTSVEDTLATFENVQAYRWSLKDGDESVFSFSVEDETITATITGPTTATVDEEVTYSVTASSTLPNAVLNYSWGGGVENSLESDLMAVGSFSTSDIGEAEVFCLVESENGCSYEATLAVTVEEPVETEFTISEKSTLSVCQGDAATVIITAEPAATFAVVSSDNETVYTAENQGSVSFALSATTTSTYYIVENGTQKEEFTITVNEIPTVTITALQSVVCVGDTVQLEASMNLSDGSFFWGGADNFDDATSGNPKFVATSDGHYSIFCQVTGAGNCVGTAETSVMVYPTPTVTITGPAE